jgi:hypothetical protein
MTRMPSKAAIGKKAAHELHELIVLTAYLYVAFGAVIFFRYAVLREQGTDLFPWGLALIKAVLVAKFVLLGRALRIGERHRSKPLIWPTLHKSVVFIVVVLILTAIEEVVVGLIHGRTTQQSLAEIGGGNPEQLVAQMVLLFMIFFPYFAVQSLSEVMGENALVRLFFMNRQEFRAIERAAEET